MNICHLADDKVLAHILHKVFALAAPGGERVKEPLGRFVVKITCALFRFLTILVKLLKPSLVKEQQFIEPTRVLNLVADFLDF